jgi:hypothetical protein
VTQHARQATPVPESMGAQDQLAALQLRVAMAEATARLVAAEQASALGRRTTAEHLLATHEVGASRWSAYFRFNRPAGSSGKEVKQQLHSAR